MTQNQAEHLLQPGVHIDDSSKVFVVEILKSKNVSILKDLMKEKRSHRLDHVDASELILEKSLKNVDLTPLMPFLPLSQFFPRVEENRLHIIVQAQTHVQLYYIKYLHNENSTTPFVRIPGKGMKNI